MSGSKQEGPFDVWGFKVPRKANGRSMWPRQIKEMAAAKFAAGHTVAAIARELTANESLVGKWVREQRSNGSAGDNVPRVSEVVAVIDVEAPFVSPSPAVRGASCELQIGDVRLTVTPGYPGAHLTEILRAVRASQ